MSTTVSPAEVVNSVAKRFSQMSVVRDQPVESETEARGYVTKDGYVHEVVSRSPNRQTVTKRVTVTQTDTAIGNTVVSSSGVPGGFVSTAPKLSYSGAGVTGVSSAASSDVGGNTTTSLRSEAAPRPGLRPLPTSSTASSEIGQRSVVYGAASVAAISSPTYTPASQAPWQRRNNNDTSNIASPSPVAPSPVQQQQPREVQSLGALRWVTTVGDAAPNNNPRESIMQAMTTAQPDSTPKAVRIGGSSTTLYEPSRVSPVLVREAYAPVKYVSKRELRAMRDQSTAHDNGEREQQLRRRGSVPRLDSYLEEQLLMQQHSGRDFCPNGYEPPVSPTHPRSSPYSTGHRSVPVPQAFDGYQQHQAYDVGGAVYDEGEEDTWDSVSQRSARSNGREGGGPAFPMYGGTGEDVTGAAFAGYVSPSTQRSVSAGVRPHVTTVDQLPNVLHVTAFAERIAFCRRIVSIPQPPSQCNEAFRLLYRGTYVVKYGRQGFPHERFMALRLVETERTHEPQPFLVWSTHHEASSFKERIHLALLTDVIPGTGSVNFSRHMIRPGVIIGPSLNGKKTTLPATMCFSLIFESNALRRSVDCLTLDEQTYHCWLMVCQYFACINRSSGVDRPVEAETMAPDTPRSLSSAAFA